jgi:hypothetical protein
MKNIKVIRSRLGYWIKNKVLAQKAFPTWVGGLQIQVQACLVYISIWNTVMIAFTFWYTVGPTIKTFAPWASLKLFVLLAFLIYAVVLVLDYRHQLPARMAFISKNSYEHKNPAVKDLKQVLENSEEILSRIQVLERQVREIKEWRELL